MNVFSKQESFIMKYLMPFSENHWRINKAVTGFTFLKGPYGCMCRFTLGG